MAWCLSWFGQPCCIAEPIHWKHLEAIRKDRPNSAGWMDHGMDADLEAGISSSDRCIYLRHRPRLNHSRRSLAESRGVVAVGCCGAVSWTRDVSASPARSGGNRALCTPDL